MIFACLCKLTHSRCDYGAYFKPRTFNIDAPWITVTLHEVCEHRFVNVFDSFHGVPPYPANAARISSYSMYSVSMRFAFSLKYFRLYFILIPPYRWWFSLLYLYYTTVNRISQYVIFTNVIRLTLCILILLTVSDLWYNRTKEVISWEK